MQDSFSYWVCEKSDGIRVLLFISTVGENQGVFLVRVSSICWIADAPDSFVIPCTTLDPYTPILVRVSAGQTQQLSPASRTLFPSSRRSPRSSEELTNRWRTGSGRRSANKEGKASSAVPPRLCFGPQHSFRQETLRYLCFDCLVIDDQYVMDRSLDKRYGVCRHISFTSP